MWTYSILGHLSRVLALRIVLVILIGTAIGSVLPEFGNVLAARIDIGAHAFNIIFLVVGITGVVLALYLGYRGCQ